MTGTDHADSHVHDHDSHLTAIEADLEYFHTKRLLPRVVVLARRGTVTLSDLVQAGRDLPSPAREDARRGLDAEIQALQDRLDAFITDIAATIGPLRTGDVVIEDMRKERGDYDGFFRFSKRAHGTTTEARIAKLKADFDESELLLRAFTRALLATGEMTEEQLVRQREAFALRGYRNGARLVARAWVDPDFKRRLIEQGRVVARELDVPPGRLGVLGVAENTDHVHNVVVCTLCSCYPADLLGDPPWWYRTDQYKQRIIEDPREMLRDMFGLQLPDDVQVRVHDSTSDVRWMVLPRRPEGTEGMTEHELADLVTPESMVGTAVIPRPAAGGSG